MLDPFKPERPEDVAHLLSLQADVHQAFKDLVRQRRGAKLAEADGELFSGAFWSGRQALARGLIDGIGHLHQVLKQRFGDKARHPHHRPPQGWGLKRLGFGAQVPDFAAAAIDALETRALWSRFGL